MKLLSVVARAVARKPLVGNCYSKQSGEHSVDAIERIRVNIFVTTYKPRLSVDRPDLIHNDSSLNTRSLRYLDLEGPSLDVARDRTNQKQGRLLIVDLRRDHDCRPSACLFVTERRAKIEPDKITGLKRVGLILGHASDQSDLP